MESNKYLDLPSHIREDSWFFKDNEELCRPHIGKPYLSYSTHSSYNDYFGDFI